MKLTVGDYLYRTPGILNNITMTWQKDYPWETKLDDARDADMLVLPHVLDISLGFTPIHKFTPNNSIDTPFISIDGRGYGSTSFTGKVEPIEGPPPSEEVDLDASNLDITDPLANDDGIMEEEELLNLSPSLTNPQSQQQIINPSTTPVIPQGGGRSFYSSPILGSEQFNETF